jgi:maltooligosyltrehalose trehalohydrolase
MTDVIRQHVEVPAHGGMAPRTRRLPVGAEIQPGGGVHFRVWAPRAARVDLVLTDEPARAVPLEPEPRGYFSGLVSEAAAGTRYRYRLEGETLCPDPVSRFQPDGPHGASCVIDPAEFRWTDAAWPGASLEGRILYELHIGTFTAAGTFAAATREIPELATLGIGVLELLPVAEFAGEFGWGYDGVSLFAPSHLYGSPDDLRRLVDEAHRHGIAVILDVVYNHVGPDGSYWRAFSDTYFTDRYDNEWGDAINFDGPGSGPVRELVLANAAHWIEEFHLDGLRLDATQQVFDASPDHILAGVARTVREAARGRTTILVAENEPQHTRLVRPVVAGGHGLDALWNDDFHHAAKVALTGRHEAYYSDYRGTPQELISALKWGFLYQGQRSTWQRQPRGTPGLDLAPSRYVTFVDNHDQVANSGRGERAHQRTSPGRYRAISALLLLGPGTPMLFQGQEFAASSPFHYFADHQGDLGRSVRDGRREFLSQFPALGAPETAAVLPDPRDRQTFERSKLDLGERVRHAGMYTMHRDLIALRRLDPVFRSGGTRAIDGAVLGPEALVLRFFAQEGDQDRLLLLNLGRDLPLAPAPEPLLAPPSGRRWEVVWSSEAPAYGGLGTAVWTDEGDWHISGHAAVVLAALPDDPGMSPPADPERAPHPRPLPRGGPTGERAQ